MTAHPQEPLPAIIAEYLTASDGDDIDAIIACFTDDALVIDEGKEWRGHRGIRQWREIVAGAYQYTVERRGAAGLGEVNGVERHDVFTHLEGNFPGGTVDLTNRFGLSGGRIATLQIVPTEAGEL
jgi:hypothetical protein